MSLLTITNLSGGYGAVRVLHDISIDVEQGTVASVLGANGAGKTTLLRAISGLLSSVRGSIEFEGRQIAKMRAEQIARLGIVHVPEGRGTFTELTVEENLEVGALLAPSRTASATQRERVYDLFPPLADRRNQPAGLMSGGEQQMLALGRALVGCPRLLLMDEPSMGLAPIVVTQIFEVLRSVVAEDGLTCLLVEQNARVALDLASYAYVLSVGEIHLEGPAQQLANDESVHASYLAL